MSARNCASDRGFTLARMPAICRRVFARGYSEVAAGLPWSRDYDRLPEELQFFYEYGRLEAANICTAGLRPGKFLGTRRECDYIDLVSGMARAKLGSAIPPEVAA